MHRIKKQVRGESIVEVMVAMAVASIIILAAIQLVSGSYGVIGETNKRIEAINLAQEGVEIIRNTRDTNWLKYSGDKRKNWLKTNDSFLDATSTAKFVEVDLETGVKILPNQSLIENIHNSFSNANTLVAGGAGNNTSPEEIKEKQDFYFRLYKNSDGVLTSDETNGDPSPYYRSVKVKLECANNDTCDKKIKVTSKVFWEDKDNKKFEETTIKSDLYDFYELD